MKSKIEVVTKKMQSVGKFLNRNANAIAICFLVGAVVGDVAFASGGNAQALWNTIANLLETWVTRFGGVVMFVGGVMFGIGWQSDDPTRKTQGIQVFTGGAIITAVAQLTSTFFA